MSWPETALYEWEWLKFFPVGRATWFEPRADLWFFYLFERGRRRSGFIGKKAETKRASPRSGHSSNIQLLRRIVRATRHASKNCARKVEDFPRQFKELKVIDDFCEHPALHWRYFQELLVFLKNRSERRSEAKTRSKSQLFRIRFKMVCKIMQFPGKSSHRAKTRIQWVHRWFLKIRAERFTGCF